MATPGSGATRADSRVMAPDRLTGPAADATGCQPKPGGWGSATRSCNQFDAQRARLAPAGDQQVPVADRFHIEVAERCLFQLCRDLVDAVGGEKRVVEVGAQHGGCV